ncbi:MAG TPA: bifunctional ornithine acetyltransferase/N-acetylglutamate synthase, partial [Ktedonobacterales bacterium]
WQCALAGEDPNWGRIMAALGASGAELDPSRVEIALGEVMLVRGGVATDYDQDAAKRAMGWNGAPPKPNEPGKPGDPPREVRILLDLHAGAHEATAWGCDLTHGYIIENTTYTR